MEVLTVMEVAAQLQIRGQYSSAKVHGSLTVNADSGYLHDPLAGLEPGKSSTALSMGTAKACLFFHDAGFT